MDGVVSNGIDEMDLTKKKGGEKKKAMKMKMKGKNLF